jgi:hypothetical protein
VNIAMIMTTILATALAACGSAGANKVAAGAPAQAGSGLPSDTAQGAPSSGKESPMTHRTPPTPAVRPPRPGEPILPSPIQPPAEVDPPHRDPGDRIPPPPPRIG